MRRRKSENCKESCLQVLSTTGLGVDLQSDSRRNSERISAFRICVVCAVHERNEIGALIICRYSGNVQKHVTRRHYRLRIHWKMGSNDDVLKCSCISVYCVVDEVSRVCCQYGRRSSCRKSHCCRGRRCRLGDDEARYTAVGQSGHATSSVSLAMNH